GVLGLYTEFTHPGVIAPGVIGGICLILALYDMHFLPVNLAGLFLIALALAFVILEAKAPSHGVLAFGGVVSMFLGALFLIRSPLTAGGVSLGVALSATVPCALLAGVPTRRDLVLEFDLHHQGMGAGSGAAAGAIAARSQRSGHSAGDVAD